MQAKPVRKVEFKKIATQFVVEDVVRTAQYYRDVLGFEILGYFADPPVYAMVARGGVEMHFGKADNRRQVSSTGRRRVGFDAYIWVDDISGLFDELTKAGAEIVEGPVKRVYESTEFVVKDCNGFTLVFGD
ncbi:MAG TPA: VOC family protein [Pyrinomonadaceae bacterium]|nr:VOC family protein [Pyrinomonadaceae bacterium]